MSDKNRILVGVFSGLVFSGKSFWRERIAALPSYNEVFQLAMDDIRRRLWGDKELTKTEHVFKNEATRDELKTTLIVNKPPAIFLEMVMLTHESHQLPFVKIINSARCYLQKIEVEECEKSGVTKPADPINVDPRIIYFYCDLDAVRRRIKCRTEELERLGNRFNVDVVNFNGYINAARQMELPIHYEPLYLDTSNESPEAQEKQEKEILEFFSGEMPTNYDAARRHQEASRILEEAR